MSAPRLDAATEATLLEAFEAPEPGYLLWGQVEQLRPLGLTKLLHPDPERGRVNVLSRAGKLLAQAILDRKAADVRLDWAAGKGVRWMRVELGQSLRLAAMAARLTPVELGEIERGERPLPNGDAYGSFRVSLLPPPDHRTLLLSVSVADLDMADRQGRKA